MSQGEPSKNCFYYWFVEPLKLQYKDDGSLPPTFEIPVETQFGECQLALYFDSEGRPNFVRLMIPGFAKEELKQEHAELLQVVKEHLLSILRLMYDSKIQVAPVTMWAFPEDGKPYSYGISIQQLLRQQPVFPTIAIRNAFVGTWGKRTEIKLLADSLDERIPLQYRYLSVYKILEGHFRKRGKWREKELKAFLGQFSVAFDKMGITIPLHNYIHALRDRCAHIKTGKGATGVTQLSQRQAAEVQRFLPLMEDICISLLNSVSNGKFTLFHLTRGQNDDGFRIPV